jgi:hypothetical protein
MNVEILEKLREEVEEISSEFPIKRKVILKEQKIDGF